MKLAQLAIDIGYSKSDAENIIKNIEASDYVEIASCLKNHDYDCIVEILNKTYASLSESYGVFSLPLIESNNAIGDIIDSINSMTRSELIECYSLIPQASMNVIILNDNELRTLIYETIQSTTQPATGVARQPNPPISSTSSNQVAPNINDIKKMLTDKSTQVQLNNDNDEYEIQNYTLNQGTPEDTNVVLKSKTNQFKTKNVKLGDILGD